jgi:putative membrane protein
MRSVLAAFVVGAAFAFALCTFALPLLTPLGHAQSTAPQESQAGQPAGSLGTPQQQQQPAGTTPGGGAQPSARDFAVTAAIANKFEVIEGQLALVQASDPALKEFAQLMVKDHTAALEELKAAARAGGIDLPADIAPDAIHQARLNAIKNRRGADFDQAYLTDQVQGHHQAVAMLATYARTGGNAALKAWATRSLTVVRANTSRCCNP